MASVRVASVHCRIQYHHNHNKNTTINNSTKNTKDLYVMRFVPSCYFSDFAISRAVRCTRLLFLLCIRHRDPARVLSWAKHKQNQQLNKKSGKKSSKLVRAIKRRLVA